MILEVITIFLKKIAPKGCKKGAPSDIVNSLLKTRKRVLLMTNLQEKRAHFNQKFIITNNGGEVSVYDGLILLKKFLHQTNFQKLVDKFIPFREKRLNSVYPLVAFDGVHGDFLKAELRPGNVYTSTGADTFIQELLTHVQEQSPLLNSVVLRADSGFALPAIYNICEEQMTDYLIRLKSNARLKKLTKEEEIDRAIDRSNNYEEFLKVMKAKGYEIKEGRYLSIKNKKINKFMRTETLGIHYMENSIKYQIENKDFTIVKNPYTIKNKRIDKFEEKYRENKGLRRRASKKILCIYKKSVILSSMKE